MSGAPRNSTARSRCLRLLAVDFFIALAVTALLIAWSSTCYRLSAPPAFDDVSYLQQSAFWYHALTTGGIGNAVSHYVATPPHAPFTEGFGLLAMLLFGLRDVSPYILQGIWIFVLVRFTRYLLRDTPLPLYASVILLAVSLPIVCSLVVEFRPDFACGLLTAGLLFFILHKPLLQRSVGQLVILGLVFTTTLMIKVSTYPQTVAIVCFIHGLRSIADLWLSSKPRPWKRLAARAGLVLGIGIALALPHYIVNHAAIHYYIRITLFGSRRDLWIFDGSPVEHLLYYLSGEGGIYQLGWLGFPLLACALICSIVNYRFYSAAQRTTLTILWTALFIIWLLPTLNQTKTLFLGTLFQFSLLVLAIHALGETARCYRDHRLARCIPAVLVLMVAAGGFGFQRAYAEHMDDIMEPLQVANGPDFSEVYRHVRPYLAAPGDAAIMLTAPGIHLNGSQFIYTALRDDNKQITQHFVFQNDEKYYEWALTSVDLVIAPEANHSLPKPDVTPPEMRRRIIALLRASPRFSEVPGLPGEHETGVRIFATPALIERAGTVAP